MMNPDPSLFEQILAGIPDMAFILFRENLDIIRVLDGEEILKEKLPGLSSTGNLENLRDQPWNGMIQEMCRKAFEHRGEGYQVHEGDGEMEFRTLSVTGTEGERIGILFIRPGSGFRKRERNELRKEKEEAQETSEIKSRFMARFSHEIRTPLNAIIGFIEQLHKTPLSDKQENYLKIIDKSSVYLLDLVNEILTYSKLESGDPKLEMVDFRCEALFDEIHSTFKNRADEKKINFRYSFDKRLNLILKGDVVRLKQVVINLVSNALKFTEFGYVELTVEQASTKGETIWIRIRVSDTGIGISRKKLGVIFKEYRQASSGIARKHGGTGLGLTISKRLTELMNGTIGVSSKDGKGSVFTVEIPLLKSERTFLTKETLQVNTEVLSGKSALIVDDDAMNRMLGQIILEGFNMEVSLASDGSEAIAILKDKTFEVILLDIHMPMVSGLDVADFIRASGLHRRMKIIAVTADMIREDLENYLQQGIDDYIIKPFREISLFNKLCQLMEVDTDRIKQESVQIILKEDEESRLYDLHELRSVTRGNEAFFKEMIQTFVENAGEGTQQIRAAMEREDWTVVRETAHRLIPSFKHLYVKSVVSDLVELKNQSLHTPDLGRVRHLVQRIEELTEEVIRKLRQEKYMEL